MSSVRLRTRLALLLGALVALTATAVGVIGYRLTASSFRGEIAASLSGFADRLSDPDGLELRRSCSRGSLRRVGPDAQPRGPEELLRPRRFGAPAGVLIQCIDVSGSIVVEPRLVALPVTAEDRRLASGPAGVRATRTVDVEDRSYLLTTVAVGDGAVQIARELSENAAVLSSLIWRFVLVAAGAGIVAVLAGLILARKLARPLTALTSTAEDIATHGRLDVALPKAAGDDETGRLTAAFATMVDALRTSREQQTQLVHDAGHELRTPLTSIRANIGVLRRHPNLSDDKRRQVVDDLHSELSELTDLVDELVVLAAGVSTDPGDGFMTVNVGALVQEAVQRWRRRSGRPIDISVPPNVGEGSLCVEGDPRLLARAVSNLLSNAVKFSPDGSAIDVEVAPVSGGAGHVAVTVRDRGPGVEVNDQQRIFDRFYRSTVHRNHPGSGLGLSIVAQIAQSHGGSVVVENAADGGARFTLRL